MKAGSFLFPFLFLLWCQPAFCLLAQRLVVQVPAPFSRIHSNRSFGPGSSCYCTVTSPFPRASCNSPGTLALPSKHLSGSKIQAFLNPLICLGRKVWSSITAHTLVCTPVTTGITYLFLKGLLGQHQRMVFLEAHIRLPQPQKLPLAFQQTPAAGIHMQLRCELGAGRGRSDSRVQGHTTDKQPHRVGTEKTSLREKFF